MTRTTRTDTTSRVASTAVTVALTSRTVPCEEDAAAATQGKVVVVAAAPARAVGEGRVTLGDQCAVRRDGRRRSETNGAGHKVSRMG